MSSGLKSSSDGEDDEEVAWCNAKSDDDVGSDGRSAIVYESCLGSSRMVVVV